MNVPNVTPHHVDESSVDDVPPFVHAVAARVRPRRTRQTFGIATDAAGRPLHDGEAASGSWGIVPDTSAGLRTGLEPRYLRATTVREHVEGQVAALMRTPGASRDVVLYLNNRPCERGEAACDRVLPAILPAGSRLTVYVVAADGELVERRVYPGTGDWVEP